VTKGFENRLVTVWLWWIAVAVGFLVLRWPGVAIAAVLSAGVTWMLKQRPVDDEFDGGMEWEN
jgi:hypothetical protein